MAVLNRSEIPRPSLPAETVTVPELNGDVIVQSLLLKDRLTLFSVAEEGSADRFKHIAPVLAATVVDSEKKQFFTAEEWEIFGTKHIDTILMLFNKALELSGMRDEDSEKKESPQS